YVFKPFSWMVGSPTYAGKHWSVKNLFELKNAQRVLMNSNIFENNWADAQVGFAVLFTSLNDQGTCSWCTVANVTFTNNIIRHSMSAINASGHNCYAYDVHPGCTSQTANNLLIKNNLIYDIDSALYDPGHSAGGSLYLQVGGGYQNITFD